jgi:ribonuclease HII
MPFARSACRYEILAYRNGFRRIAGIDEVGRGALAGPVVAACVILDPHNIPEGIIDSKLLTDRRRRRLDSQIRVSARALSIGMSGPATVDRVNILNATREAMGSALSGMPLDPDFLLIDAVILHDISISSMSLIKGDRRSVSIAAASIVAKVYRDDLMIELGLQFPQYGFQSHKGYGTEEHRHAIATFGPTVHHRKSFEPLKRSRCHGNRENCTDVDGVDAQTG